MCQYHLRHPVDISLQSDVRIYKYVKNLDSDLSYSESAASALIENF